MVDLSGTYLGDGYQITITRLDDVNYDVQYPPDESKAFPGRGPFRGVVTMSQSGQATLTVNFTDYNQTISGVAVTDSGGVLQRINFTTGATWTLVGRVGGYFCDDQGYIHIPLTGIKKGAVTKSDPFAPNDKPDKSHAIEDLLSKLGFDAGLCLGHCKDDNHCRPVKLWSSPNDDIHLELIEDGDAKYYKATALKDDPLASLKAQCECI